jgi:serine protease Do
MNNATRSILIVVFLAAGIVAGLGLGRAFDSRTEAATVPARVRPEVPAAIQSLEDSFSAAAEFAMPSVVHITTQGGGVSDFLAPQGVGSGVIVSDKGHILTNNHVAELAGERGRALRVRFSDGKEVAAKIMGTDSESDLALLKIDAPRDVRLIPITFADSDKVQVGHCCLAIGSPFGYNHTVTAGIVSAKHRRAQLTTPYQDFIQTDAAINPGNSGGALVNLRGELIGINTAIVSESRGNEGLGFAIASNLARWVKDRLLKDGKVRRGYMGIRPLDFDAQLVDAMREEYGIKSMEELLEAVGLKEPRGIFVYSVEPGTPAAKGGLKDKDVIIEFNGKPVTSQSDMFFKVAEVMPDTQVSVKVLRDKKEKDLTVVLAERDPRQLVPPARRRPR